jgi:hypothetical protein
MIQENYVIRFAFTLEDGNVAIPLTAVVDIDPERKQYQIKDLRSLFSPTRNILPDILIKKSKGQWVYSDSGRANNLSLAVGQAIDEHERNLFSESH